MHPLMRNLGRDQESHDCRFAKRLARFKPMKSLDQNKAAFVGSNVNGRLLSNFQNTFRDLLDDFGVERLPPLHRNVNLVDWEAFRLEHSFYSVAIQPNAPTTMAPRNGAGTRGPTSKRREP